MIEFTSKEERNNAVGKIILLGKSASDSEYHQLTLNSFSSTYQYCVYGRKFSIKMVAVFRLGRNYGNKYRELGRRLQGPEKAKTLVEAIYEGFLIKFAESEGFVNIVKCPLAGFGKH